MHFQRSTQILKRTIQMNSQIPLLSSITSHKFHPVVYGIYQSSNNHKVHHNTLKSQGKKKGPKPHSIKVELEITNKN